MKVALKLRLQMYQILTKDDEVCIPILSSILLAVLHKVFQPIDCEPVLHFHIPCMHIICSKAEIIDP